jgi:uncharacterized protein YdhG (YjbR/CyaY superfamily)
VRTTLKKRFETIDEYIATSPRNVRDILEELRRVIRESAPDSEETISYGIPTFDLNGRHLVHFAAYENHIGFYPTSSGITRFKKELSRYQLSRGTVRFPINEPVPFDLIRRIVKYRVKETLDER